MTPCWLYIKKAEIHSLMQKYFDLFQHVRCWWQRIYRSDRDDKDRQVNLQHDGSEPGNLIWVSTSNLEMNVTVENVASWEVL